MSQTVAGTGNTERKTMKPSLIKSMDKANIAHS